VRRSSVPAVSLS